MDEPTVDADEGRRARANPTTLVAAAFLAPWIAVSLLLPDPYRVESLVLLAALAGLLVAAGAWSYLHAGSHDSDPAHWAFMTVVTFGVGMLVLLASKPAAEDGRDCFDCGRIGELDEPFCFGCGSTS